MRIYDYFEHFWQCRPFLKPIFRLAKFSWKPFYSPGQAGQDSGWLGSPPSVCPPSLDLEVVGWCGIKMPLPPSSSAAAKAEERFKQLQADREMFLQAFESKNPRHKDGFNFNLLCSHCFRAHTDLPIPQEQKRHLGELFISIFKGLTC